MARVAVFFFFFFALRSTLRWDAAARSENMSTLVSQISRENDFRALKRSMPMESLQAREDIRALPARRNAT